MQKLGRDNLNFWKQLAFIFNKCNIFLIVSVDGLYITSLKFNLILRYIFVSYFKQSLEFSFLLRLIYY